MPPTWRYTASGSYKPQSLRALGAGSRCLGGSFSCSPNTSRPASGTMWKPLLGSRKRKCSSWRTWLVAAPNLAKCVESPSSQNVTGDSKSSMCRGAFTSGSTLSLGSDATREKAPPNARGSSKGNVRERSSENVRKRHRRSESSEPRTEGTPPAGEQAARPAPGKRTEETCLRRR